jgi:hypothetical protein
MFGNAGREYMEKYSPYPTLHLAFVLTGPQIRGQTRRFCRNRPGEPRALATKPLLPI